MRLPLRHAGLPRCFLPRLSRQVPPIKLPGWTNAFTVIVPALRTDLGSRYPSIYHRPTVPSLPIFSLAIIDCNKKLTFLADPKPRETGLPSLMLWQRGVTRNLCTATVFSQMLRGDTPRSNPISTRGLVEQTKDGLHFQTARGRRCGVA